MPYNEKATFQPPWWQIQGDLQTMIPGLWRKVHLEKPIRHKIATPDFDFLLLDHYPAQSSRWAILCHGLEGDSRRPYMVGMAKALLAQNYQLLCWNYRSCGGEPNLTPLFYHSGATYDLETVIDWVKNQGATQIHLVGFSLGGNLVLKYLGERSAAAQASITAAAAVSVPVDLASSSQQLDSWRCWPYRQRFLKTLKAKIWQKAPAFPGHYQLDKLPQINRIFDFDEYFTAAIHGFDGAADYYKKAASLLFLENIQRPTLLLQAANDPFLSPACYPRNLASQHAFLQLEITPVGGHVGFMQARKAQSWPEQRVVEFFANCA